jgi:ketosteroid isomerase-like protein
MRVLKLIALLVVASAVACAPQTAQESPELAAKAEAWEAALNAGDVEAIVALYTDNARLLPPNKEMMQGAAAVRAEFGEMIAAGLTGELETTEAMAAGDMGYRVGTYKLMAPDGSVVDRGKYIETWTMAGGEWRLSNDIWNSDLPADAGGTQLLATHDVKDGAQWLAAWQGEGSRHEMFAKHGVSKVGVFQNPDNPNQTAVQFTVTDMEAFSTFMESEEVQAAKLADGVKDRTLRFYTQVE